MQRADPDFRRFVFFFFVALVVVGAVSLWAFQDWLSRVARAEPIVARHHLLLAFACLMGASCALLVALGVYLWRTGARVHAAGRFPPPGMRVLHDTPVLHGAAASRRARLLQGMGVALLICCLGLVIATWRTYTAFAMKPDDFTLQRIGVRVAPRGGPS